MYSFADDICLYQVTTTKRLFPGHIFGQALFFSNFTKHMRINDQNLREGIFESQINDKAEGYGTMASFI